MLCGLRMPSPEPIGAPSGITAAQPASASLRARIGSSLVYGSTTKPSATRRLGGVEQFDRVGQQGDLVGDDLELDPVRLQRLAGELGGQHGVGAGVAAGGVGQHARSGAGRARRAPTRVRRVDPAHRDRGQLGARRPATPPP